MPAEIVETLLREPLAVRLARIERQGGLFVHWLGQAGFIISVAGRRIVIDPYLSDSLAAKYRGTATPHERMMPAPVAVEDLGPVDVVLVTHQHTDHMDPGTLAPLAKLQPAARFVVPTASRDEACRRIGVGPDRLILADAGQAITLGPGLIVRPVRAAHEELAQDEAGHHRFLGYAITVHQPGQEAFTLVHTGDTVPFPGQRDELAALKPNLLLLPVNGRSPALKARGIAGNLTLDEAIDLTEAVGAGTMIAHHHGMFAFNTLPLADIVEKAGRPGLPIHLIPAQPGLEVSVKLA